MAHRVERMLVVTHRGRTTAVELPERGVLVIGRSRSCEVFLDDHQVSRRHAAIHVEPGRLHVEDLGSHNGTLLLSSAPSDDETRTGQASDVQLEANVPTLVADDALIQIGTALLTIQTHAPRIVTPARPAGVIVADPGMQRVLELADRVAPTSLSVLVLGESGVGKDVLARYLHAQSPRRAHRLVSLNCGALPESLLESELFGHEKGAFTGAASAKPGLFEAAHHGTLFLDEVGELTPALQVKLLRVLEDRQVLRVGALEPRTVDVRFVAATNRDLEQHVATGKFREDLYYRLNGLTLYVPPLRERRADIVPLVQHFLADLAAPLGKRPPPLSRAAADKLAAYAWPGNVRQLKNIVHRALVMSDGPELSPDDFVLGESGRESRPTLPAVADSAQLRQLAEDAERRQILDALDECAGNQTRAAQRLGITRRALVRRLEKYNLPRPRRDAREDDDV